MALAKNTSTAPIVNLLLKDIFKKGTFMKRKKHQKDITHPHFFAVRLSDMELEFLNRKSEKLGISKAEVIRKLLSEKPIIHKFEIVADLPQIQELISAYWKISTNLNQIAKYYNTGGEISMTVTAEIRQCINDLYYLRKDVLDITGVLNYYNNNL